VNVKDFPLFGGVSKYLYCVETIHDLRVTRFKQLSYFRDQNITQNMMDLADPSPMYFYRTVFLGT